MAGIETGLRFSGGEDIATARSSGSLHLSADAPGRKNNPADSRGHGVQHALEERHHISPHDIAETLLRGKVRRDPEHKTRLHVRYNSYVVVLEREMEKGSDHASKTKAKLLTALKRERR